MKNPTARLMLLSSFVCLLAFSHVAFASQSTRPTRSEDNSLSSVDSRLSDGADVEIVQAAFATGAEEEEWDDEDLEFDEEEGDIQQISDPLAPWNRAMFQVNDRVYYWILRPVARGYRAALPGPVRIGVKNFFHNLTTPLRFLSCILQGKGDAAVGEFAGFFVNSTFGILGFFDIPKNYPEWNPPEEDLGQVLGAWGIGNGFYIVWPFLGPSTLRDSLGMIGDRFLSPTTYIQPPWVSVSITGLEKINATSFRIGDYESLKDAAIEPYEAFRDAYIQNRMKSVAE